MRGTHSLPAVLALVLSLLRPVETPAQPADGTTAIGLTEARILSVRAVQQGRPDIAHALASRILAQNPEDSLAHYVLAQAYLRSGRPEDALAPARQALRYATTPVQRHEAARLAALSEAGSGRHFMAQIWMRRALQTAPTPDFKRRAVNEFRAVRHEARLSLDIGMSMAPSSNVNGGSSERINTIDGVPLLVGVLSPEAQALSGTEIEARLRLGYRLRRDERSETTVRGYVWARRVRLSDDAREIAPEARNGDFASDVVEVGVAHRHQLAADGTVIGAGAYLGRVWFAGDHGHDFGRLEATAQRPLGDRTALQVGIVRQMQQDAERDADDVLSTIWRVGLAHRLENGDHVSLFYHGGRTEADNTQARYERRGLSLDYRRAKPVGPLRVGFGFAASEMHFPDYRVLVPVPGGRDDREIAASLDLAVQDLEYMGFVPTVELSAERTTSNVSRFKMQEYSISIGFRSAF